ncbi:hypothetical protein [Arthrobacter sp. CAN_A1]|uniref:hypothetical protein n=1 Tax=Arthrobacter sp. CAN_A1 TaxID=2787717 RepID=UPI0018CA7E10
MSDGGDFRINIIPRKNGTRYYTVAYSGDRYFTPVRKVYSYQVLTGPETRTTLAVSATGPVTVSQPVTPATVPRGSRSGP